MSEFELIATYFTWDDPQQKNNNIIKSVGDDAAVLALAPNQQLVTSIDTLVSGVHFPISTTAFDIGYKALAVNLSDLAAMGANPEWFTLALTLPEIDHEWLSEFSHGLRTLAKEADIALVGGDTTSGPLSITIQVMGSVENGAALYRNGATQGDKIYVSGSLGDGAAGLLSLRGQIALSDKNADYCQQRLNRPMPRFRESVLIREFASACMDISDGLLQDLNHTLTQSNISNPNNILGACLDLEKLPLSTALQSIDKELAIKLALTGGDDYELLFTIPENIEDDFLEISGSSNYQFTRIGTITKQRGIIDFNGKSLNIKGFEHFL